MTQIYLKPHIIHKGMMSVLFRKNNLFLDNYLKLPLCFIYFFTIGCYAWNLISSDRYRENSSYFAIAIHLLLICRHSIQVSHYLGRLSPTPSPAQSPPLPPSPLPTANYLLYHASFQLFLHKDKLNLFLSSTEFISIGLGSAKKTNTVVPNQVKKLLVCQEMKVAREAGQHRVKGFSVIFLVSWRKIAWLERKKKIKNK